MKDVKKCSACGEVKGASEFYQKNKHRLESRCKDCHNELRRQRCMERRPPTQRSRYGDVAFKIKFTSDVESLVSSLLSLLQDQQIINQPEDQGVLPQPVSLNRSRINLL